MSKANVMRTRRLRASEGIRRLVRETKLSVDDLVYPLFIEDGEGIENEIAAMPGIKRFSLDRLSGELDEVSALKIPAILLFGIPSKKDASGSQTWDDDGIMQRAIKFVKKNYPDLYVITDVCFCEYTDHGHCGVIVKKGDRHDVDNDATLDNLVKQTLSHARAGVDMVAPSGMMDGAVGAMREGLDAAGFSQLPIMGYSVKYASAFMAHSAKRLILHLVLVIAAHIKWILLIVVRDRSRPSMMTQRGPIFLWLNLLCLILMLSLICARILISRLRVTMSVVSIP